MSATTGPSARSYTRTRSLASAFSPTSTRAPRRVTLTITAWAIYGQARGETVMNDWALVQPAAENKPGKVRLVTSYTLKPGMAHVYNEGDLHSPRREGPTRLIRIEGTNMDKVRRLSYERA